MVPYIQTYFISLLRDRGAATSPPLVTVLSIHTAAWEQSQLGWDNGLCGCLSSQWQHQQCAYYWSIQSSKSADRWIANLVYRLLQVSHKLWTQQNGILHKKDAQGMLLAEGLSLRTTIEAAYTQGTPALLPADHHLVTDRSLEDIQ